MTSAWFHGQKIQLQRQSDYICRPQAQGRTRRRHSNFWRGLSGHNWIVSFLLCPGWVEELMGSHRNKQPFYQRGLRAMTLIPQAL